MNFVKAMEIVYAGASTLHRRVVAKRNKNIIRKLIYAELSVGEGLTRTRSSGVGGGYAETVCLRCCSVPTLFVSIYRTESVAVIIAHDDEERQNGGRTSALASSVGDSWQQIGNFRASSQADQWDRKRSRNAVQLAAQLGPLLRQGGQ